MNCVAQAQRLPTTQSARQMLNLWLRTAQDLYVRMTIRDSVLVQGLEHTWAIRYWLRYPRNEGEESIEKRRADEADDQERTKGETLKIGSSRSC